MIFCIFKKLVPEEIYEKDTHEAKLLVVENEDAYSLLEARLIESIDNHYILRPCTSGAEEDIFRFDITSCEKFSEYLVNRKLSRTEMIGILAQLKSVITTLEDHMLGDANILLEPEHLYIDRMNRKVRFVPVCQTEGAFSHRLRRLTEAMFLHADLEDVESLRFAARMLKVSMQENVRLHDLMQLIENRYSRQRIGAGLPGYPEISTEPARIPPEAGIVREQGVPAGENKYCYVPEEEGATVRLTAEDTGKPLQFETSEEEPDREEPRGFLRKLKAQIREKFGDEDE